MLASVMETRAFRIKLKPGSRERVREWAEHISRHREEALETLRDEGVLLECFFLEQRDDDDYLIAIMTAASFDRSKAVVQESTHDIDAYHRAFQREVWDSVEVLERLVELPRLDEIPAGHETLE